MGVGGGFWDELRPVRKDRELAWLRGKRLAIDLSFWIVQQQAAIGAVARKPHLRVLFFRVVNLVARVGALPVFVVDGHPPAEKLRVRMERFGRMTGLPVPPPESAPAEEPPTARNSLFQQSVDECVELLEVLGMPVLRAAWEAEGLCAELDREGWVDACVTPDSDAFLHGATCVIKALQSDPKDPLVETYAAEDVAAVLGLERRHMIALALLVGCDYDKRGVAGIGCGHAMRLVRSFSGDEIFERLRGWGRGDAGCNSSESDGEPDDADNRTRRRLDFGAPRSPGRAPGTRGPPHCGHCGHPGTKPEHTASGCAVCTAEGNGGAAAAGGAQQGCVKKGKGFQCTCPACEKKRKLKKQSKRKDWWSKYCGKVAATDGFPNERIIDIFLRPGVSNLAGDATPALLIKWRAPDMALLEDFLRVHLSWDAPAVRRRTLPLLSAVCLQSLAAAAANQPAMPQVWNDYPLGGSIAGRFVPHAVERVKVDHATEFYVLRWRRRHCGAGLAAGEEEEDWLGRRETAGGSRHPALSDGERRGEEDEESADMDAGGNSVLTGGVESAFTTIEDMRLVETACPDLVEAFEQEQAVKEMARAMKKGSKRKAVGNRDPGQQSIKSFFRVMKGAASAWPLSPAASPSTHAPEKAGGNGAAPARPLVRRNLFP